MAPLLIWCSTVLCFEMNLLLDSFFARVRKNERNNRALRWKTVKIKCHAVSVDRTRDLQIFSSDTLPTELSLLVLIQLFIYASRALKRLDANAIQPFLLWQYNRVQCVHFQNKRENDTYLCCCSKKLFAHPKFSLDEICVPSAAEQQQGSWSTTMLRNVQNRVPAIQSEL